MFKKLSFYNNMYGPLLTHIKQQQLFLSRQGP